MSYRGIFNGSILLLGTAEAISSVGNWITMMAVFSMLVFRGNGGVATSSGVFLAGLLPVLIFSPLAGRLCDKYDQTKLMVGGNILAGLAISFLIRVERLDLIFLCVAMESVFLSIITPARQSLLPRMVPRAELTRTNAFLQQISSAVKIFGPMIGAFVVGLIGPHRAIILDVFSFLIATVALMVLSQRIPLKSADISKSNEPAPSRPPGAQTALRCLSQNPPLKLLFIGGFLAIITLMGLDVLSSVYTRDVLHADEGFYGISIGILGFGSVLSGVYLFGRKGPSRPFLDVGAGLFLLALKVLALGVGVALEANAARAVVLAASFVGGWGNGLVIIQASTILQTYSPRGILGTVSGLFQTNMVAGQLTALVLTPIIVPRFLPIGSFLLVSGTALVLTSLMTFHLAGNRFQIPAPVHDSAGAKALEGGEA